MNKGHLSPFPVSRKRECGTRKICNTFAICSTQAGRLGGFRAIHIDRKRHRSSGISRFNENFPATILRFAHNTIKTHYLCLFTPIVLVPLRCTSLHPLRCVHRCVSISIITMNACMRPMGTNIRHHFYLVPRVRAVSSVAVQCARKWKIMCRINLTKFQSEKMGTVRWPLVSWTPTDDRVIRQI